MVTYIALLIKEGDGYCVEFPDLPGCVTCGDSLKEAAAMAREALGLYLDVARDYGDAIKAPSSLDAVIVRKKNTVYLAVEAPERKSKAVRINITIPENVLKETDARTKLTGETRSGFLTRGALQLISGLSPDQQRKSRDKYLAKKKQKTARK